MGSMEYVSLLLNDVVRPIMAGRKGLAEHPMLDARKDGLDFMNTLIGAE